MRKWAERTAVRVHLVHGGGHAWPEDLEPLAATTAAKERIGVHTDCEELSASVWPG